MLSSKGSECKLWTETTVLKVQLKLSFITSKYKKVSWENCDEMKWNAWKDHLSYTLLLNLNHDIVQLIQFLLKPVIVFIKKETSIMIMLYLCESTNDWQIILYIHTSISALLNHLLFLLHIQVWRYDHQHKKMKSAVGSKWVKSELL